MKTDEVFQRGNTAAYTKGLGPSLYIMLSVDLSNIHLPFNSMILEIF